MIWLYRLEVVTRIVVEAEQSLAADFEGARGNFGGVPQASVAASLQSR